MAIKITQNCINCGNCETKCPNNAIYEVGKKWSFSYSSDKESKFKKLDGTIVASGEMQEALSHSVYYIVPEKCTECVGFHDEPQCIPACPVDCCIYDENHKESRDELKIKRKKLRIF